MPTPRAADERFLLHAIADNPHEDNARHIYADWLDDQGDPLGEFVRVQLALSSLESWKHPDWEKLERRQEELWTTFEDDWLAPARALGIRSGRFQRGTLHTITLDEAVFRKHHHHLFEQLPTVRKLVVRDLTTWLGQFIQWPDLRRVLELDLSSNGLYFNGMSLLASCEHLGNIEHLNLSSNYIGDAGCDRLSRCEHLMNVKWLGLSSNAIGDQGIRWMLERASFPKLQSLRLDQNILGGASITCLAGCRHLRELQSLSLTDNFDDTDSVYHLGQAFEDLAESNNLPNLRELFLGRLHWLMPRTQQLLRQRFGDNLF